MQIDSSVAAIVTGGASGLGEATARMLAAQGARVALFDLNAERGEKIATEIGGLFVPCDVTSEASVDEALAKARAAQGVARILVNCAGIAPGRRIVSKKRETGELVAHDTALFEKALAINLTGTFRMLAKSAAALAALEPVTADGGRGVFICTASIAAEDGQIGQAAYAASKAGVGTRRLRHPRHDDHARPVRDADVRRPARGGPRLAGDLRPAPLAAGQAGGICGSGEEHR